MNRGYIKIWRKIEDSGLLQMHGTLALFIIMLMKAAYKPCRFGLIDLERGQFSAGRFQLAEWSGLSEQSVRTNLKHLHDLDMVTSKPTNKFTVYTIVNYGQYQDCDDTANQQTNQQLTNNQPATNQQLTTNKELKHLSIKELKTNTTAEYSAEFELAWSAYPSRPGANKKETFKVWKARIKEGADTALMIDGATRYANYCKTQCVEPRFIKQAVTFFGIGNHYLSNWNSQAQQRKPQQDNFETKDYGTGVNLL
jgi:hypothetical protein